MSQLSAGERVGFWRGLQAPDRFAHEAIVHDDRMRAIPPLMRAGSARGAALHRSRALGLAVSTSGDLLVSAPDSERTVSAGTLTRAVVSRRVPWWMTRADSIISEADLELLFGPAVVLALFAGAQPVVVLDVREFSTLLPQSQQLPESLFALWFKASGAQELVRALGLSLSIASDDDDRAIAAAPSAELSALTNRRAGRPWGSVLILALVPLVSASWLLTPPPVRAVLMAAILLVCVPVVGAAQRLLADFLSAMAAMAEDPQHAMWATAGTTEAVRASWLEVTPDVVRFCVGGCEATTNGPRGGGATHCIVGDDVLSFTDAEGWPRLTVESAPMLDAPGARQRLEELCRQAEIAVSDGPTGRPTWRTPGSGVGRTFASGASTVAERGLYGGILGRYLLGYTTVSAALVLLWEAMMASPIGTQSGSWDRAAVVLVPLALAACTLVGTLLSGTWRHRRVLRRALRPVPVPAR